MNIDKAIKNLRAGRKDCGMIPPEEFTPTIDLAIEALERIKEARGFSRNWSTASLQGETEE